MVDTPALPAGVLKLSCVSEMTVTAFAALPPTVALVVPVKFVPDKVMVVPPEVDPLTGEREVMVGALLKDRAYNS